MINAAGKDLQPPTSRPNEKGRSRGDGSPPAATRPVALGSVQTDTEVKLVRVEGGRSFQHRLAEMGLIPGITFRVLSGGGAGPFIISIRDARLMLGRGMATRVLVQPI